MLDVLDACNVEIVTPFTHENFLDLVFDTSRSTVQQLLNVIMVDFLRYATVMSWDPETCKLGTFIYDHLEGAQIHEINACLKDFEPDENDSIIKDLLDKYGDAYADGGMTPLMILTDKETGELYMMDDDDLREIYESHDMGRFIGE